LRRIIADLRSGLLATSVSLNLLNVVAESLDRGVLLVPDGDQLVALGAFGQTALGEELARKTENLAFPVSESGVFFECLRDSHTRRMSYDSAGLQRTFRDAVDRPLSGEIAVLPVPGSERMIAIIYLDNGARDRPVGDIEIFELAAFQLGLALENEFLRRSGPERGTGGPVIKMRTMG
jgi:GAF domain-containing protein